MARRKLNVSEYCVWQTIKRMQETGQLRDRTRSGRPKLTTKSEDQYLRVLSLWNRRLTAPRIAAEFNVHHRTAISVTTVKRHLAEFGLKGPIAAKKPRLSAQHKQNNESD